MSSATAEELADRLVGMGVRVVAWDMDHTMSAMHCGKGLPREELGTYVAAASAEFAELARALAARPVGMAVATGSDPKEYEEEGQSRATHILGPDLAAAVIEAACGGETLAAFGIMVGFDTRLHGNEAGLEGKRHHLRRIQEHYGASPEEVLLIDDSQSALDSVASEGARTCKVQDPGAGFRHTDLELFFASAEGR